MAIGPRATSCSCAGSRAGLAQMHDNLCTRCCPRWPVYRSGAPLMMSACKLQPPSQADCIREGLSSTPRLLRHQAKQEAICTILVCSLPLNRSVHTQHCACKSYDVASLNLVACSSLSCISSSKLLLQATVLCMWLIQLQCKRA